MNSFQYYAMLDVKLEIGRVTDIFGFVEERRSEFSLWLEFLTMFFAELDGDFREDFASNFQMIWTEREVIMRVVEFWRVLQVAFYEEACISSRIERHDVKGLDFIVVEEPEIAQW